MHVLPMAPHTFSWTGTSLIVCCSCQSNHSCKISFGWSVLFFFMINYNLKHLNNSCTVPLHWDFCSNSQRWSLTSDSPQLVFCTKSPQTFATNLFHSPQRYAQSKGNQFALSARARSCVTQAGLQHMFASATSSALSWGTKVDPWHGSNGWGSTTAAQGCRIGINGGEWWRPSCHMVNSWLIFITLCSYDILVKNCSLCPGLLAECAVFTVCLSVWVVNSRLHLEWKESC